MDKKPKGWIQETRSTGVTWLGSLMVVGSLIKIFFFVNYDYYRFLFQPLSDNVILIRYLLSVVGALIGLISGVGVLLLREVFRKLAVVLCVITLVTVFWKHPMFVFRNVAVYIEHEYTGEPFGQGVDISKEGYPFFKEGSSKYKLKYENFPLISMSFYCVFDIVFCLAFIFYFNQNKIKEQFV